uniref:Uncharacterized protein n=1 Tax=Romanomermis culicivorax TaxID=13658 RepID=A0A915JS48_ROMCU
MFLCLNKSPTNKVLRTQDASLPNKLEEKMWLEIFIDVALMTAEQYASNERKMARLIRVPFAL